MYKGIRATVVGSLNMDMILSMQKVPETGENVLGMRGGIDCIGEEWKKPIGGKIHTSLMGMNTVDIEKAVDMTLSHIE